MDAPRRNIGPVFSIHLVFISMHLCTVCGISCLISKNNMNFICYVLKIVMLFKTSSKRSKKFLNFFLNILTLTTGCFYIICTTNCWKEFSNYIIFSRNWSCISGKIEIMMSSLKYTYAKKYTCLTWLVDDFGRCDIFWSSHFGLGLWCMNFTLMIFELSCDWLRDAKIFCLVILDLDLVVEFHLHFWSCAGIGQEMWNFLP